MTSTKRTDPKYERAYDRGVLRAAFVSLFSSVIGERKKRDGLTLQALAKKLSTNKAEVSRWFNGDPNWTLNTIGGLANALNVEVKIQAVDRTTGEIYTPAGLVRASTHSAPAVIDAKTIVGGQPGRRPSTQPKSEPPMVYEAAA